MSVSALDSRIFKNLFGTQEIREVFSDEAYIQRLIETEAALARAEASVGVIPSEAGKVITKALSEVKIDYDRLSHETEIVGYPVLPLVRQLVENTPEEMAKYIHWGATTQDIMDDASMLQIKQGLQIIQRELESLIGILERLVSRYRDTPMAGRTHLQHALPITFGYKLAVYLSSILRHRTRLCELRTRCLLVQFGGAAGTLASLGSDSGSGSVGDSDSDNNNPGLRVRAALAQELDLLDPPITWHVARDTIAEILNFLALVGGTLGKIAFDVMVMSSNEVGEVSEPFVPHRGASSTMPQKRNPISSEVVLAASKLLRASAGLGLDAMVSDFERASGPWHLEWVAVPEAFVVCVGALHQMNFAMGGLVVDVGSMSENLRSTRGLIVGEAVMMGLAPFVGRQKAHDVVYEACKTAIEEEKSLLEALKQNSELMADLDEEKLIQLCDPLNYLGASQIMVDNVLHEVKKTAP